MKHTCVGLMWGVMCIPLATARTNASASNRMRAQDTACCLFWTCAPCDTLRGPAMRGDMMEALVILMMILGGVVSAPSSWSISNGCYEVTVSVDSTNVISMSSLVFNRNVSGTFILHPSSLSSLSSLAPHISHHIHHITHKLMLL